MSAPAASLYIPHGEFLLGHPYTSKSLESPKEIYIPKEIERETHAMQRRIEKDSGPGKNNLGTK